MNRYESPEAAKARSEFSDVNEKWARGEATTSATSAARRRWHKLRDRDAAIEATVREALEPSALRNAADGILIALSRDAGEVVTESKEVQEAADVLRLALTESEA